MKAKFTKKIAREIAERQFDWTLDCVIGRQDPDFNFNTQISEFEQNFTEDLEEKNITVTPKRIEIINGYYEKLAERATKAIERLYSKTSKSSNNEVAVCKHENVISSDGCDECLDCGARNY